MESIDLEVKLRNQDAVLFSCLEDIKKACADIWKDRLLPWFTNHDCAHSEEIIHLLGQILKPLENNPLFLNKHELFVLLSAAYLHDIGMQFLKIDGISVDSLTETQYDEIRRRHAEESYNIILKRVKPELARDDFHLPNIDEEYLPAIARVAKGHSTDYFADVVAEFKADPLTPKNREIRGELLTALLMLADELDLQAKRVDFCDQAKLTLSSYSLTHWYKHHYIDFVEICSGKVRIRFRFPQGALDYPELIKESLKAKLLGQIEAANPMLSEQTGGLLHLDTRIEFEEMFDTSGVKRPMPPEVVHLLRQTGKSADAAHSPGYSSMRCSTLQKPSAIFTGRKEELDKFKNAFVTATFLSIEGLGGIGKTEFALKCIESFIDKERVVWFDCGPDSKLDLLIDCAGYPDLLKGESKTELSKYSGFTDLIERDGKAIFLDNFQDALDASFKAFFKFAERRLSVARIILISREHPDSGVRIAPVQLDGLGHDSAQYARKLIDTYYPEVEISDADLGNVCESLKGHPFAIDFAVQLLRYGERPENILHKIVEAKGRSEELSERLLSEVFDHPRSTEGEKELLVKFSVYRFAVEKDAVSFLMGGNDVSGTLALLIDKKMITLSLADNLYGAHPLIREFCYQKLADKAGTHLKAAEYFETRRGERFDAPLEEKIFHHFFSGGHYAKAADLVSQHGESFIRQGHTNALSDMIAGVARENIKRPEFEVFLGDIATIRGDWKQAMNCYENALGFENVNERILAEAYIKYGEVLFRKGEVKEAMKYYEDAYESSRGKYPKEEARALNDIGLALKFFGDLTLAEKYLEDGLKLRIEINDREGIAASLNNIGHILIDKGSFDLALKKYEESLKISEKLGSKEGIAISINSIGYILFRKGDLDPSLLKCEEGLRIYEEIGSKEGIASAINNIGLIFKERGELAHALEKYKYTLCLCEEIGFKEGIATSLNNIAGIMRGRGDLDLALQKYSESLKIHEEIGSKKGIATSTNNIGHIFHDEGKLAQALQKYSESLKICEDICLLGNVAVCRSNIGVLLFEKKEYAVAMKHLIYSQALKKRMGLYDRDSHDYILEIRKFVGLQKFKALLLSAIEALPVDLKPYINLADYQIEDTTVRRESPKVGQNDPCPCGSGKKYKKCCGKS